MKTIFEKSRPGRSTAYLAAPSASEPPIASLLPAGALREKPPGLPEVSELEIVRPGHSRDLRVARP